MKITRNDILKAKLIYKPFLISALSFICIYTFLDWLLLIKLHLFAINEDLIHFWLPFTLPWIVTLKWLKPRIRLLNLKTGSGRLPSLYHFVAVVVMCVPTMIAQSYIESVSGKLTKLENISAIDKDQPTKFYELKNYYIDKKDIGLYVSTYPSGKYNENFDIDVYVTLPIFDRQSDTSDSYCKAWLGVTYYKQISNHLSNGEKENKYREFMNQCQVKFDSTDFRRFVYLDRPGVTDTHANLLRSIQKSRKYDAGYTTILVPVNKPFGSRDSGMLGWIFGVFGIGALIWWIMILIPDFSPHELSLFRDGKEHIDKEMESFIKIVRPSKGYYATPVLLYLNVAVFMIMVLTGSSFISVNVPDCIKWGGNYGPLTLNGQWWRLVTCIFIHGGIVHLFMNMIALVFISMFLERSIGTLKYSIAYMVTGIIASISSVWWHANMVGIGASGAIMGISGLLFALILTKVFSKDFGGFMRVYIIATVCYTLFLGFFDNADNAAHIGGFASGFILGLIFSPLIKSQLKETKHTHNEHDILAF